MVFGKSLKISCCQNGEKDTSSLLHEEIYFRLHSVKTVLSNQRVT